MKKEKTSKQLSRENEVLRIRLREAEDTLQAIREGMVDAVVVSGPKGEQVFTLTGENVIYRHLVETMSEAGLTTTPEGRILFCNERFATMLKRPMEKIIGQPLENFVQQFDRKDMAALLVNAQSKPSRKRLIFVAEGGTLVPARVSANLLQQPDSVSICLVAMDMTELEASEEVICQLNEQRATLHKSELELHKLNRILRTFSNNSQAMIRAEDESLYLQEVCKVIDKDCGYTMVWIGYAEDDQAKTVRPVAYSGFEEGYLETLKISWADNERGRGPTGTAIRTSKTCFCRNTLTDPAFKPWRKEAIKRGYTSSIALPLLSDDKAFGSLNIYSKEPNQFSEDEVKLLTKLASDLSYGIIALRSRIARNKAEEALRKAHDELDTRVKERTAELGEMVLELQKQVVHRVHAEEAFRSASLYARGLFEASLDPFVTISPEGKITDINRATELVTGLSREGLIGSDFSGYFTEPQKAKDSYKKALSESMVKDYPLTIRHISGHTTDVLYNTTVYKNEAGQVQGVFAAARDVTERNRTENRVRITNVLLELFAQKTTRKEYLDSVVNAIRDLSGCQCVGIRLTNSDGLIPYESQVGFTKDFLAIEDVLSLKTDTCACMRVITQKPEPQDALAMTSKGSFRCDNTFEFFNSLPEKKKARYRGHCIRHGFASLAVVPIRYRDKVLGAIHLADKKENKTPAQTVEFIENMAMLIGEAVHRFDVEVELRQSEDRYRQLVELSPEGIGVERDDKIVFMNTAAARLLGTKNTAELIGRQILDFVHPDYRKRTHRQLEYLRRKGEALPLRENIFLRVDGTTMDVEVAATPLIYGNRLAAQIVFRDITERKLAQERIIADQKQLRLLTAELLLTEERERHEIATALHDSLGPILAFSKRELGTLQKSVPAEVAEALKNISDNIGQAIKQTRTLTFDLSPPTLYTLGFEIAIEELLELFCQEHKLEYSFRNSDQLKPLTDPVKVLLYRSTREMLINIAKHAKAKLVKVTLARNNNDIQVTLEDDGKGFDTSSLKGKPKGLGLFSVRERLRHIGGKLEIESKRGKGTHITLTAPLKIG